MFARGGRCGRGGGAGEEGAARGVGLDFGGAAAGGLGVEVWVGGLALLWKGGIGDDSRCAYWSCGIRGLLAGRYGLGRPGVW